MTGPVLKVQSLRKEFGGLVAVKDVSFEVGEGEFVGLIGPNGCGKSTTFNCISGLLEQTSGKIEMFGEDISELRPGRDSEQRNDKNIPAHKPLEGDDCNREPNGSSEEAVRNKCKRIPQSNLVPK